MLETINTVPQKELSDGNFLWLQQARFYWRPDEEDGVDDDGRIAIVCTDAGFHMFEYLSFKGRLVITPLTDRCYITLSQAMNMCYVGAPAGRRDR